MVEPASTMSWWPAVLATVFLITEDDALAVITVVLSFAMYW